MFKVTFNFTLLQSIGSVPAKFHNQVSVSDRIGENWYRSIPNN